VTLWYPVDFYVGVSLTKGRLLEVPTIQRHRIGVNRAVRLEWCILLHFCIIIDLKRVQKANTR
jgi:hypothetical protein